MAVTQIKICGLKTEAEIDAAVKAGATHIGLNLYESSPRSITSQQAAALRMRTPPSVKVAILLVDADADRTQRAIEIVRPDIVQFHGTETPEWLRLVKEQMRVEVWKALGVKNREVLLKSDRFVGAADRLLFDAPAQVLPGGTGTRFDWSLLRDFDHRLPWALAGGLTAENVADAIMATGTPMVDTASGVESAPGVKDVDKIARFCKAVREYAP